MEDRSAARKAELARRRPYLGPVATGTVTTPTIGPAGPGSAWSRLTGLVRVDQLPGRRQAPGLGDQLEQLL